MSVLEKLTEGIVNRDLQKEGEALLNKWEATGLLEGIGNDAKRTNMARLLENQARELLREASAMSSGDVEGFAAVAFPIVRRVFGGLIANDLVSVQPMSLPSGLIFFLDFTFGDTPASLAARGGALAGDSLFGGLKVGQAITGGIDLSGPRGAESGFYGLNQGFASATGSVTAANSTGLAILASGTFGGVWYGSQALQPHHDKSLAKGLAFLVDGSGSFADDCDSICRYDPDLVSGSSGIIIAGISASALTQFNRDNLQSIVLSSSKPGDRFGSGVHPMGLVANSMQLRRLTQYSGSHKGEVNKEYILMVFQCSGNAALNLHEASQSIGGGASLAPQWATVKFAEADDFGGAGAAGSGNTVGVVAGQTTWALENNAEIPEIDIKVDSVSVTAITKKLKAKWTPELGQDLNAYHNLDAEVELTSILSEQIALEIDREILEDLIKGATAGTYHWSRSPGMFVNRTTGAEIGAASAAPDFTGTVSEWYETLIETVNDVSANIHRKTLRGGANFVVCSPEVANILEFTAGFRGAVAVGDDRGSIGAQKTGALSKKFDVYVDPYFPRNVVLVGRKGASFLESGYVYAPYVPLQVTPTIFGVEDFVPRKGVLTRYAKKMVRPDMYGLVVVRGLLGEAGA